MAVFGGEFLPVVVEVARRLEGAQAQLAAMPPQSAPGWDQRRMDEAQAEVRRLQQMMTSAERHTLHHIIDLLECIPQDLGNYLTIREALQYARALASIEDKVAA